MLGSVSEPEPHVELEKSGIRGAQRILLSVERLKSFESFEVTPEPFNKASIRVTLETASPEVSNCTSVSFPGRESL